MRYICEEASALLGKEKVLRKGATYVVERLQSSAVHSSKTLSMGGGPDEYRSKHRSKPEDHFRSPISEENVQTECLRMAGAAGLPPCKKCRNGKGAHCQIRSSINNQ